MENTKKNLPLCAYCGVRPGKTRDHAIPKALFVNIPTNIVTVPACSICNGEKSQFDSYLRDCLVCDLRCSSHPVARAILDGPMGRAIRRNRSAVTRKMVQQAAFKPLFTRMGIYLGHAYAIQVEGKKLQRGLKFIMRGLYYDRYKTRMSDDYVLHVIGIDMVHRQEVWDALLSMCGGQAVVWGDDVFTCCMNHQDGDPNTTVWGMLFYNGMMFLGYSLPPDASILPTPQGEWI